MKDDYSEEELDEMTSLAHKFLLYVGAFFALIFLTLFIRS